MRAGAAAVLLAVVVGGSPVPVGAEPRSMRPFVVRPADALSIDRTATGIRSHGGIRSVSSLLRPFVRSHRMAALPAALRAFVAQRWGLRLPDLDAIRRTAAPGPRPAVLRFGLPVGDLDGNRRDDALDLQIDFSTGRFMRVAGLRSTDGRALWSIPLETSDDALPLPVGDLTGDRAADVLLVLFDIGDGSGAEDCVPGACVSGGSIDYRWTFALVSGPTGKRVWTRTYDGTLTLAETGTAATGQTSAHATNVLVLPLLSGDIDHDRWPDLVLDAIDLAETDGVVGAGLQGLEAGVGTVAFATATRAGVISGRTGSTIYERSHDLSPGVALLYPVGNAVGNAASDLVWEVLTIVSSPFACASAAGGCIGIDNTSLDLEMVDGSTLAAAWTTTIDGLDLAEAETVPAEGDASGDRRADLVLYERRETRRFGVVSGATGAVLWTRSMPDAAVPILVGDATRDRSSDFVLMSFVVLAEPTEEHPDTRLHVELRFDGISGRTGGVFRTARHEFGDSSSRALDNITSFTLGDGDRDGVEDIAVDVLYENRDLNDFTPSVFVESGRTGRIRYRHTWRGFGYTQPAGDATADRSDDLVVLEFGEDDIATVLVDLDSVRTVWRRLLPLPDGFLTATTEDQSGRGGDDQIFSRLRVTPAGVFTRIDGVEARTGTISWGSGPRLPRRPRGYITGKVTSTNGRALADICVIAHTREGLGAGFDSTAKDGTYRVSRLRTGLYKVLFQDCGQRVYANRWYRNKRSLESATVISVTDGRRTGGIDASLPRAS